MKDEKTLGQQGERKGPPARMVTGNAGYRATVWKREEEGATAGKGNLSEESATFGRNSQDLNSNCIRLHPTHHRS